MEQSNTAKNTSTNNSETEVISEEHISKLSYGLLEIYEKPFKTIEAQLGDLNARQSKIVDAIQIINNNKDKNYKSKLLVLEETCARISRLITQIKNNHARMVEITKTVKLIKTNALRVKKNALNAAAEQQEQLLKEQNLIAKPAETP